MKIKRYLGGLIALSIVLTLAACESNNESDSESKTSETQTSYIAETSSNVENEPQDDSIIEIIDDSSILGITITVDTVSYIDEQLTFEYEGEEYTLPLSRNDFVDDSYWPGGWKSLSEQVINNKLGEAVKAEMKVSENLTEIYRCDIINKNGMAFNSGMLDDDPEDIKLRNEDPDAWKKYAYTMTKIDGTRYEFSNIKRTLLADLNDLSESQKVIYPDSLFDVSFYGYLFEDGQFIINELLPVSNRNEEDGTINYRVMSNSDYPKFFGTVQNSDGKTADIILTDDVTVINVPTYYCEEELSPGQEVMVTLDCDTKLFGSGEAKTFDYAVIHTDPKLYNYDNHVFSTLAYANSNPDTLGAYDYVFVDEVQP